MAKYKRRLIPIIDRGFQFKYTGIMVLVAGVVSTVLGFLLLSAYREMNEIIQVSEMIGQRMDADDARRVFYMVVGFLVAEVVIIGLLGLLITHRVCGPIFVVNRNLRAIIEGRYPSVRPLRSGDEFREAFDTMVDVITILKERDDSEAKALREIIESARAGKLNDDQIATLTRLADERAERVEA
jgi:signal transduction histidine kinase